MYLHEYACMATFYRSFKKVALTPGIVALIFRNGGSDSSEQWRNLVRNIHNRIVNNAPNSILFLIGMAKRHPPSSFIFMKKVLAYTCLYLTTAEYRFQVPASP